MRCAELSAGEQLAGTATVASRILLIEHRGRWGRDPLDEETALPEPMRSYAREFDGRTLLIRQPGRRSGRPVAGIAEVEHGGGAVRPAGVAGYDDLPEGRPLVLVCAHGRRDPCCAERGVPVFEALASRLGAGQAWQSSHQGGHRFAANVLLLPSGVQLGRVGVADAPRVVAALAAGAIPLEHYRGRTLDAPRVQCADAAVRRRLGLDAVAAVRPLRDDGAVVELETPQGTVRVRVDEEPGPALPASCGADPEPTRRLVAHAEL